MKILQINYAYLHATLNYYQQEFLFFLILIDCLQLFIKFLLYHIVDPHFSRVFSLNRQDLFLLVKKNSFGKVEVATYFILFYFKRENKTRKKTLKK